MRSPDRDAVRRIRPRNRGRSRAQARCRSRATSRRSRRPRETEGERVGPPSAGSERAVVAGPARSSRTDRLQGAATPGATLRMWEQCAHGAERVAAAHRTVERRLCRLRLEELRIRDDADEGRAPPVGRGRLRMLAAKRVELARELFFVRETNL